MRWYFAALLYKFPSLDLLFLPTKRQICLIAASWKTPTINFLYGIAFIWSLEARRMNGFIIKWVERADHIGDTFMNDLWTCLKSCLLNNRLQQQKNQWTLWKFLSFHYHVPSKRSLRLSSIVNVQTSHAQQTSWAFINASACESLLSFPDNVST